MPKATNTQRQRLTALIKDAPAEIPHFAKAAELLKAFTGLSISGDRQTLKKIQTALDFEPLTEGGQGLKKNILSEAQAKATAGVDGNGWFFID